MLLFFSSLILILQSKVTIRFNSSRSDKVESNHENKTSSIRIAVYCVLYTVFLHQAGTNGNG